jgi:hypothetical protein
MSDDECFIIPFYFGTVERRPRTPLNGSAGTCKSAIFRQLARDDARHVEHVFDEQRLRPCVSFDDFQHRRDARRLNLSMAQHRGPSEDGVQGSPQLVRKRLTSMRAAICIPIIPCCAAITSVATSRSLR